MLEQLDPFSVYVPPAKQEDFDRMLEGSFKGVGIQLDQRPMAGRSKSSRRSTAARRSRRA